MGRFNNGTVFTNDKCIACNKCIAKCGVVGANVSTMKGERNIIEVDSRKCISCGNCINVCTHGARDSLDDSAAFFASLAQGEKISVILDPTFHLMYGDSAENILGYLEMLGVEHIYDGAFGSEISIWLHGAYVREHHDTPAFERAFIANTCPAIVNEIELYHPFLVRKLIPVQSPMMCSAVYARKYLHDDNVLAFIGPCIAKREEIRFPSAGGLISYSLTYRNLDMHLRSADISRYSRKPDVTSYGIGNMLPGVGGMAESVSAFFKREEKFVSYGGSFDDAFEGMELLVNSKADEFQPLLADVRSCKMGCFTGPGTIPGKVNSLKVYETYNSLRRKGYANYEKYSPDEAWNLFCDSMKELNRDDFTCSYRERYRQPYVIPKSTYDEIYAAMLKDTPEKRHVNCGSCGYRTCKEMVAAIANGYNHKENCIHYMNDATRLRYMYNRETGFYNGSVFMSKAGALLVNEAEKHMLIYGNINKLGLINDLYGFAVGDIVIKRVAERFKGYSDEHSVTGYLGAGTFLLFTRYSDELLDRIRHDKAFDFGDLGVQHQVSIRYGVYVAEDSREDIRNIVNYAAMASGENVSMMNNTVSYFSTASRDSILRETQIAACMRTALENNEFAISFQPQYDAATGEMMGAEALCRLTMPDGTRLEPTEFIPIAEKNGFVYEIDRSNLRTVCAAIRRWIDSGLEPPPIAVNISKITLETDELMRYIGELREEYGLSNQSFYLEFTESVYEGNPELINRKLERLRNVGIKVALNNFGSGTTSVTSLKDLPIDILKLDISFLKEDSKAEKGGMIISALVRMAQNLDLTTVAVGVETQSQADFLTGVGIDVLQGYAFSEPLSEHELVNMMNIEEKVGKTRAARKPIVSAKMNIAKFYDSSSVESYAFETFAGPAALLEFDTVSSEMSLLRCNRKSMVLLGCEGKSMEEFSALFRNFLLTVPGQKLMTATFEAIYSDTETPCALNIREQKGLTELWLETTLNVVSQSGDRYTLIIQADDCTDREIAQSMLKLANAQLNYLMKEKDMGTLLFHVNTNNVQQGGDPPVKVLRTNEQFTEMTGYTEEELTNLSDREILEMIHPMDRQEILEKIRRYLASDSTIPIECVGRHRLRSGYYEKFKVIIAKLLLEDGSFIVVLNYTMSEQEP